MNPIRLTVVTALALTATGITVAAAAPTPPRSGCAIVTDAVGDTAANVGAPAGVPRTDEGVDITAVDVASTAKWIGARVRVARLDATTMATGGESFEVTMNVGGGTLVMGAGRYANATGISGDDKYAYAGFQRGALAPRDVPARAVQIVVDPAVHAIAVFVDRAALRDIGADTYGYLSGITATSGRQYADTATVGYDDAAGPQAYKLGAPSCLRF